jgi:hypothetical protein
MENTSTKSNLQPDLMDSMTWKERFWMCWIALVQMEGKYEALIASVKESKLTNEVKIVCPICSDNNNIRDAIKRRKELGIEEKYANIKSPVT